LVLFLLLCLVGLAGFITAFSAGAGFVQMNSGPLAGYADSDLGTTNYHAVEVTGGKALVALDTHFNSNKEKDSLLRHAKPDEDSGGLRSLSEPNTWVQIAGGFALLIGIQRVRKHYNHWV
jgi:phosphate/sulfate permease